MKRYLRKQMQLITALFLVFVGNASLSAQCNAISFSEPQAQFEFGGGTSSVSIIGVCSNSVATITQAPSWLTVSLVGTTLNLSCEATDSYRAGAVGIVVIINGNIGNVVFKSLEVVQGSLNCEENWYADEDGDTFGNAFTSAVISCTDPSTETMTYVQNNNDLCPEVNGPDQGCPAGQAPENKTWVTSRSYDIAGTLKASSKAYFDDLGEAVQSQSVDFKTGKTWASQTMYDTQGRPALQSLSAPINDTGELSYNPTFIKKQNGASFTNADFETDPEAPSTVGAQANSLGWYYSTNNTSEAYQDITDYPFSRAIYSKLNPGATLKTIGGNKINGEWKNGQLFTMPAGEELSQAGAFNDGSYNAIKTVKTISRDLHGVENVVFADTDGRILAAARTGGTAVRNTTIPVSGQGFVDVHVPVNTVGFTINGVSGITTQVFDLITEQLVTTATTSLPNGFYRISVTNPDNYNALTTPITVTCKENYYDYSLNEYNDVGYLIASKQPLNHLETTYKNDALGRLLETNSPDEGISKFKHQEDGLLRFSQNSKQLAASPQEFSYTNYDFLGRPIESGVIESNSFSNANPDNNLPTGTRKEQFFTKYDEIASGELSALGVHTDYRNPQFLAGNVAKSENAQSTSYYSYDIYGRVEWVVQDIADLGIKTIDYIYDDITSQVDQVIYQKHIPSELFIHKYTYNPVDNSFVKVETSTNGSTYTEHATYEYFETGRVKNVKLAGGIQQTDYIYNLAGQLKAINHPALEANLDPGGNSNDMFGMTIDYYNNDYKRSNNFNQISGGVDQYNGNIKGITWNTDPELNNEPVQYSYKYNESNWLTEATFNGAGNTQTIAQEDIVLDNSLDPDQIIGATNSITFLPESEVVATTGTDFTAQIVDGATSPFGNTDYKVHNITYDANGNIKTLNRNKNTENGSNTMDALTYHYDSAKPNQLKRVTDAVTAPTNAEDIKNQSNPNNYQYNNIGQLISNIEEDIAYEYNVTGLVTQVKKRSTGNPIVKFYYNDKNHRLKKESFNTNTGALLSTTHYIRDTSGTPLAIYENNVLVEHTIYGASRLGVLKRQDNTSLYQLTDHLGNVRAVIAKNGNNATALTAKTDYYPFGMPMPNRLVTDGAYRYAFQGQEKDAETGMEAFELRLWDSRIGRWLSPDPKGEFYSPYLGMGNNPISLIDPDGGSVECPDCPDNPEAGDTFYNPTFGEIRYSPYSESWYIVDGTFSPDISGFFANFHDAGGQGLYGSDKTNGLNFFGLPIEISWEATFNSWESYNRDGFLTLDMGYGRSLFKASLNEVWGNKSLGTYFNGSLEIGSYGTNLNGGIFTGEQDKYGFYADANAGAYTAQWEVTAGVKFIGFELDGTVGVSYLSLHAGQTGGIYYNHEIRKLIIESVTHAGVGVGAKGGLRLAVPVPSPFPDEDLGTALRLSGFRL